MTIFDIQSPELLQTTVTGMSLFFLQYVFLGYNIVYGEYFQSISQTKNRSGLLLVVGCYLYYHYYGLCQHYGDTWHLAFHASCRIINSHANLHNNPFSIHLPKTVSFQDKE